MIWGDGRHNVLKVVEYGKKRGGWESHKERKWLWESGGISNCARTPAGPTAQQGVSVVEPVFSPTVDMQMRGRTHAGGNQEQHLPSRLRLVSVEMQTLTFHCEAKLCSGNSESGKVLANFARHAFMRIALPRALRSKRKRHCALRRKTVGVKWFSCSSKWACDGTGNTDKKERGRKRRRAKSHRRVRH